MSEFVANHNALMDALVIGLSIAIACVVTFAVVITGDD